MLNQLCNLSLIIGLGCFTPKAFSINNIEEVPGIIESLEKLQKLNQDQLKLAIENNYKSPLTPNDLDNAIEIKTDTLFLRSILFHSDNKYLGLLQRDECKFYSLLEKELIKGSEEVNLIPTQLKFKDGTIKSGLLNKNDFFVQIFKTKCSTNKEFNVLFDDTNFLRTVMSAKYSVPKGENDCKLIHNEWLINSYTPYLCAIGQAIKFYKNVTDEADKSKLTRDELALKKKGELYFQKIPLLQKNYIENLCSNLTSPENFCSNYLKSDVWNKVINGETGSYKLNYKCQNVLGKFDPLNLADQKKCAQKFISDNKICTTKGNADYPALFPMQNCDNTSVALSHSKLIADYHDCPGNIDNEAITNVHRIINHFSPRKIVTSPDTCIGEANYSFARLNLDIKYEKGWPLKICFLNRVENKENCIPYIPGSRANESLSEDQVVAKILYLQKGASPKTQCRIVSSKKYNPIRSEFKSGCFIVFDPDSCTSLSCNKKVYWEEKLQNDIHFIGNPVFEYYPSSFANERYSIINLLNEVRGVQSRTIKNLTDLKFYLDKINSSIVHGIGCAEDLLPMNFQRIDINECHPLPFILDGYINKNGETYVVTRTAIDDLFSPRLIQWTHIFNSVANYKELHPLNAWTLNGLKK